MYITIVHYIINQNQCTSFGVSWEIKQVFSVLTIELTGIKMTTGSWTTDHFPLVCLTTSPHTPRIPGDSLAKIPAVHQLPYTPDKPRSSKSDNWLLSNFKHKIHCHRFLLTSGPKYNPLDMYVLFSGHCPWTVELRVRRLWGILGQGILVVGNPARRTVLSLSMISWHLLCGQYNTKL